MKIGALVFQTSISHRGGPFFSTPDLYLTSAEEEISRFVCIYNGPSSSQGSSIVPANKGQACTAFPLLSVINSFRFHYANLLLLEIKWPVKELIRIDVSSQFFLWRITIHQQSNNNRVNNT
ncbi:hypothetical protein AVEN_88519-1 [Araneus ventricosus]|uniref:Uncharacterized protein n=1 Tax=Araneus ventricosus TaxID=182803 RepID=A0A4Y2E5I2_ARAVE|nr:hypothetical protein AVEN_88519-1 [Araneus ventricosus]